MFFNLNYDKITVGGSISVTDGIKCIVNKYMSKYKTEINICLLCFNYGSTAIYCYNNPIKFIVGNSINIIHNYI